MYTVTLQPFGIEFPCDKEETVLAAALKAGVSLRYGCKHGGCGGCKVKLTEGYVDYDEHATALSEAEEDAGIALLCCAYPDEDLVITLDDDYTEADLTPEFALAQYSASLSEMSELTADTRHLVLSVNDGQYHFSAGQFLEINVPGTDLWRAYSMANSPEQGTTIELAVKLLDGGAFSHYLNEQAQLGDTLQVRGPYGQFGLSATAAPIIMVAGGSGMAPLRSLLQAMVAADSKREVQFFFGARRRQDLYWLDDIQALGNQLDNFQFIPALSEPLATDNWEGETGLITEVLARCTAQSLRASEGYLCGPPGMIDAAVEVLKQKGMFASRIAFDKFLSTH